jgi:membrane-associated phospholipid phosphatase
VIFRSCCLIPLLFILGSYVSAQSIPAPVESVPQRDEENAPQPGRRAQATTWADSIDWKTIFPDIWNDQVKIYWAYPRSLAQRDQWIPTVAFIAATGTLIAVDQYESPFFRRTMVFHGFNSGLSGTDSSLVIATVPAATYLLGLIKKDRYAQSTALFTAEAIADSELTAEVLKLTTRRARPESIQTSGNFGDTWLDSRTATDGSFPSGHTIAAFSAAIVMSRRYGRDHKWVPFVAYGVAGTIGFSRVTLSAHNISDVFAGAALGYAISRFVALGHHAH